MTSNELSVERISPVELHAFFAYPASPQIVSGAIERAIQKMPSLTSVVKLRGWRELDVPGRFIAEQVLEAIDKCDCLVVDITVLNFNVMYELAFAIGRGKRVFVVKNRSITQDPDAAQLGIVDTIGYQEYSNSDELATLLKTITDLTPLALESKRLAKAPIYLNQSKHRTDQDSAIISSVKKLGFKFRSFDPSESPRLSAFDAISEVSQSYGVVVHLIPNESDGARIHNLRAAFIAGLAQGAEILTCILQSGDTPVPLDIRDFVRICKYPSDFKEALSRFAPRVIEALLEGTSSSTQAQPGILRALNIGASSAENEMSELGNYYVEIDAYLRAKRKEVRLITGRKGSGKTAIFFQLRDRVRQDKKNVVLDLKPDGYQLRKFKDAVLSTMKSGTVEHTLTAFWEYLLLL